MAIGRTNISLGGGGTETTNLIKDAFYTFFPAGLAGTFTNQSFPVVKNKKYLLYCSTTSSPCTLSLTDYQNLTILNQDSTQGFAKTILFKANSTGIASVSGTRSTALYTNCLLFNVADSCKGLVAQYMDVPATTGTYTFTSPEKICYLLGLGSYSSEIDMELNQFEAAYKAYSSSTYSQATGAPTILVLKDTLQFSVHQVQNGKKMVMLV